MNPARETESREHRHLSDLATSACIVKPEAYIFGAKGQINSRKNQNS